MFENVSKKVKTKCHVCGNDQFSSDYPEDSLINAPGDTKLKCAYCGAETTKDELIADNSRGIDAAVDEITAEITSELQKELDKAFRKAFR